MRRCFKVTIEECQMKDLKRGDLFVLEDDGGAIEDGTVINVAQKDGEDGNPHAMVMCDYLSSLKKPITELLGEVSEKLEEERE